MKKSELLKEFIKNEVAKASSEFMYQMMSELQIKRKENTIKQLIEVFETSFSDSKELSFLQIVLVRHKVLLKEPFYRIETFGSQFYLGEPLFSTDLEWSWIYKPYYEFCQRVADASKRYIIIDKKDVEPIWWAELENTKKVVRQLFEEAIPALFQTASYQALDTEKRVQIHLGEYRGPYEILLIKELQAEKLGAWLNGVL